jgi:hypothetical protein
MVSGWNGTVCPVEEDLTAHALGRVAPDYIQCAGLPFLMDSEQFVRVFSGTGRALTNYLRVIVSRRNSMKSIVTTLAAALLTTAFAVSADAASTKKKGTAMTAKQQACVEQAKKKYSAVQFLKRRAAEKKCMGTA